MMQRDSTGRLIPVLLAIGAAGALWYYWFEVSKSPQVVEQPPVAAPQPSVEERTGPIHPLASTEPAGDRPELRPLPLLHESDAYFKMELSDLYGEAVADLLAETGLIERIVATVDNLPRAHVAERIRPVGRLGGQFSIDNELASGEFELSPDNFRRYDMLVEIVTRADLDQLENMYRRFYPLFQETYVELGYPNGYFNDRLVEVIDHLLETPEPAEPLLLVRPHVLYEFSDQDLEDRSSGQKLLLRMGNEHAGNIKQVLLELRERIAEQTD